MEETVQAFGQAAGVLPPQLRVAALALSKPERQRGEELRLRVGRRMTITLPEGERAVSGCKDPVTPEDLVRLLEIASGGSAHTALERVRDGYFTIPGGHRIGLCGSGVKRGGGVYNFSHLSSAAIRVARAIPGAALPVLGSLTEGGALCSTLIVSPPGGGKTTLLRDLVRCVSDGVGLPPLRVGVADERGELAAMAEGVPQMDLGRHTDVVDACPRSHALLLLLRGMNPQVLAVDEVTAAADAGALTAAAGCGVSLLATAHGAADPAKGLSPAAKQLMDGGLFRRVVTVQPTAAGRAYQVYNEQGVRML